ncbi:unnamed protein product [Spirodela intermedia]|uniref:Uncharacterized protein n=1 Tax=Spirodela intermedia TaxID=51605 RepID=A0A7I8K1B2_SPIIN|nr:unnamed protein product [Spirodela intermedia]
MQLTTICYLDRVHDEFVYFTSFPELLPSFLQKMKQRK